ncbi:MAG: hypothetical protein HYR98_03235 [Nitrospirae bacterium]|nr:hypothetical protein [Nitrospirota bacterium]MBI3392215.1 hypothetical protein [Nitrospirota bacterium]
MRRTAWSLIFLLAVAGCADVQHRVDAFAFDRQVKNHLSEGISAYRDGNFARAQSELAAARRDPSSPALAGEILFWSAKTHLSPRNPGGDPARGLQDLTLLIERHPAHPRADDAAVLVDLVRRAAAADKTNQELRNEIKKLKEAHIKIEELERKKRN